MHSCLVKQEDWSVTKMLRTFLKPLSFIPALLIMYMIYSFSAQNATESSQLSYKVSYNIVKAADRLFDANLEEWQIEEYAVRYHNVTRKIAHMGEYFLLAVAVAFPLYVYGLHGILLMLLVGFICVGFACGDEYHQSYVAGRAASIKDVAIDSFGVFWGIILVRIIGWTGRHTIFRPRRKQRGEVSRRDLDQLRAQQQEILDAQASMRQQQEMSKAERRRMQKEADLLRMQQERLRAQAQPEEYEEEPEPDEPTSDTLSEDMPFSRFFR